MALSSFSFHHRHRTFTMMAMATAIVFASALPLLYSPKAWAAAKEVSGKPIQHGRLAEHVRWGSERASNLPNPLSGLYSTRFDVEFAELELVGAKRSRATGLLPENRPKNRANPRETRGGLFRTGVIPSEWSRVALLDATKTGSDYVNASYLFEKFEPHQHNSPQHKYIAAQGPTEETSDDFWQMAWEQKSPAIVNLTRCEEEDGDGRKIDKCHRYWPTVAGEKLLKPSGWFEVTLIGNAETVDWGIVVRLLELKNIKKGGKSHHLLHFHYEGWPDDGVPDSPAILLDFIRLYRARLRSTTQLPEEVLKNPTIVHCAMGIGRTGTFIVVDHLMDDVEQPTEDGKVDVYGCVYEMRERRFGMVGSPSQYVFIHLCLLYIVNQAAAMQLQRVAEENRKIRVRVQFIILSSNSSIFPSEEQHEMPKMKNAVEIVKDRFVDFKTTELDIFKAALEQSKPYREANFPSTQVGPVVEGRKMGDGADHTVIIILVNHNGASLKHQPAVQLSTTSTSAIQVAVYGEKTIADVERDAHSALDYAQKLWEAAQKAKESAKTLERQVESMRNAMTTLEAWTQQGRS